MHAGALPGIGDDPMRAAARARPLTSGPIPAASPDVSATARHLLHDATMLRLRHTYIARPLAWVAVLVTLLVGHGARGQGSAAGPAPALTLVTFVSGRGDALAAALGPRLPSPWTAGDSAAFARALGGRKGAQALRAQLDRPHERDAARARLERAARAAHVGAVLVLRVPTKRGPPAVHLTLLRADGGDAALDTDVALASDRDVDAVTAAVAPALARLVPAPPQPPVAGAPPAPAAAPSPVASATPAPAPPASVPSAEPTEASAVLAAPPASTPSRDARDVGAAILDASLGMDVGARHFSYSDPVTPNLRRYDLDLGPAVAAAIEVYPLAATELLVLRDLGVTGDVRRAFALGSRAPSGEAVSTTWMRYDLGLRARTRVGARGAHAVLVGASASYGREAFTFADAPAGTADLPSAAYSFARARLDARVPLGPVALVAAAAYLFVLDAGDAAARLRDTHVGGVEARLGVALPFGGPFEARLGAEYTRFFYSSAPVPGDAYVAGGALDQLMRGELALAYVR